MERRVKLFRCSRSQALRIPKELQFEGSEVYLRREGHALIVTGLPADWSEFLESELVASSGFMEGVVDLQARGVGL